jgi:thioester reductase-like protein
MIYFITGITGTVVPVIVEDLIHKDKNAFFYFAIRKSSKGNDIQARFEAVVESLDLDPASKLSLYKQSKLVEIDIEKDQIGIDPAMYDELVKNTEKILHGAADVRFDQPYESIRMPNVVFTHKIYDLFSDIKKYRNQAGKSDATLYYISTGYAYGVCKKVIPEDYPDFHPGKPDNTYAQTKAEAKVFILDKIKQHNDRIVIFEPTIIGGSAKTGRTKTYNLHYIVIMLGYLGKLPFLTSHKNQLDIVPVDWVAAIISDIMSKNEYHQGAIRMASGKDAVTVGFLHDKGYDFYVNNDPVPGHVIPKIRFVPRWFFNSMVQVQKRFYQMMYLCTRIKRYRKLFKGICLLEGYFPYITGYKVFENSKSMALIEKYTDCGAAPPLQDIFDSNGHLVQKGYYKKIFVDTLETGWGGMVDFKRLEKKTEPFKSPEAAYSTSRK